LFKVLRALAALFVGFGSEFSSGLNELIVGGEILQVRRGRPNLSGVTDNNQTLSAPGNVEICSNLYNNVIL
jgi:hypothetical protein